LRNYVTTSPDPYQRILANPIRIDAAEQLRRVLKVVQRRTLDDDSV
jgi:hypothetical protein